MIVMIAFFSFQLTLFEKSLIFIPTIYKNIYSYDASIEKSFHDLGKALAKRFPNMVDYAQPAEFWDKYRNSSVRNNNKNNKQTKRNLSRKKKRRTKTNTDDEGEGGCDFDEDIEDSDDFENDEADEVAETTEKYDPNGYDMDDNEQDDEPVMKKSKQKDVTSDEPSIDYIFKPNI